MCSNYPSTPRIATLSRAAVLLFSLIAGGAASTALASRQYVSDLSLDWAVAASHGIVEAEVAELDDPKITYRVTAILKQTDAPLLEIGSLLEDARHFSSEQKLGDKTVLFFFAQDATVHAAINLSRPPGEDGLAFDRDGKPIPTAEELLARIRRLVDDGRKETGGTNDKVCQEGVVAVFGYGIVSLVDVATGDTIYRSTECTESLGGWNHVILSPEREFFAHLCSNGDVIVVDIAEKQVKSRGKLPWTLSRTLPPVWPDQFSFSPDARYLALNLNSYIADRGTALIVWRTDSGECVFTKSPNWELKKKFYIRGFGPGSRILRYEETAYWDLEEGRPRAWAMSDWRMGNVWPDPVRDHNAKEVEALKNREPDRPNK